MAKASQVNEIITKFLVEDQTGQAAASIGSALDALTDKADALADSGQQISADLAKGLTTVKSAVQDSVASSLSGVSRLMASTAHLSDGIDQISHDIKIGAGNAENALTGVQEAADLTANSASAISTAFKNSLGGAKGSASDLITVMTQEAATVDKSWQNAAARAGDGVAKLQRQIRLALNEYDRLNVRGQEAVANGSTQPADVDRTLSAKKQQIDSLIQQEARLRVDLVATADSFADMAESGASASEVTSRLTAAQAAEILSLRTLKSAYDTGNLSLSGYQKGVEDVTTAYESLGTAANAALQRLSSGTQQRINTVTGVSASAPETDSRKGDFEAAAAEADKLRAELVPRAAAQRDYTAAQEKAAQALASNIISQKEYDDYVSKAKTSLDRQSASLGGNGAAAKLTAFEMGILADETHKFFDQVLAGGSAMQAAFYQVPNMVQVMGGLRASIGRVASALLGPGALIAGLAAGGVALGAMEYAAEEEEERLAGLGQRLRATRQDYSDIATASEQAARKLHKDEDGLSLSDSRTVVQTIVSVPTVDRTEIARLTTDARNLSTILGTTVPEAAKTMAQALQDPAKAAQDFAQQGLQGFDAGLILSVQHMQQMGDRTGALSAVLKTLEADTQGAADRALTPLQQALKKLKDETGGVGDVLTFTFEHIGSGIVSMAATSVSKLNEIIEKLEKLKTSTAVSTVSGWGAWLYGEVEGAVEHLVPSTLAHVMQQGNTSDPQFKSPAEAVTPKTVTNQTDAQSAQAAKAMLDTVAAEQGLSSDASWLLHKIQPQESSTGQYKAGQLVQSSAGAIGALQVMPSNAAGFDLTDLHGNESAAAKLLKGYYSKYDGDLTLTAMAYNWGPKNVDKWLQNGSDPNALPQETQNYVANTTEGAAYGPQTLAGFRAQSDAYISKGDSSTAGQMADLQRTYAGQKTALDALNKAYQAGDPQITDYAGSVKILKDQMDATSAAIANLRNPVEELDHTQDLAARSAAGLTGYQRQMIAVAQQVDQAQLSLNGTHATAAQVLAAQARAEQILTEQWQAGNAALATQTEGQEKATAAYKAGSMTAEQATAYAQAYAEASNSFAKGSPEFRQAMDTRVAAMSKATTAQKAFQLAQQNDSLRDNLTMLKAETDSLGQNADERKVSLAVMQKDLELHREYGAVLPEAAQENLALTRSVTQTTAEYEHQQQVLQDVTGSLSSMTDQLTDGITQGFLQGTSSGMSFKNVLSGIETQIAGLVIKMGLINPLLNEIDGGTRSTLSDVNKLFSGSSSGSGSGDFSQYLGGSSAGITSSGEVIGSSGLTVKDAQAFFGSGASAGSGGTVQHNGSLFNTGASGVGQVISNSGWAGNIGQMFSGGSAQSSTAGVGQAVGDSGWAFTGGQSLDSTAQTLGGSGINTSVNSGFGSMSDMFSGNGGLMSSGGMQAAGTVSGAAGLAGGALGGLTTGYSVGKKASNLTGGGKGGKIGAAVGAGIGTVVGAVFGGPIGAMIGGAVLGTVGGVIGGLFNKKHYVYDSVVGSDGQLSIGGSRTKHASDDVRDGLQTDLDTVNSVYSDAGITVSAGNYGEVGHYHKGKKRSSTSLSDLLGGIDLSSDKANENLALQQIMPKKFDSISDYTQAVESLVQLTDTLDALHVSVSKFDDATHVTVGNITGYTGDVQKVLSGLSGKELSTSALQSEISTVKELVGVTAGNAESLVDQVADLRDKYAQAADQAKRYGLDYQVILDKGNAIAQQMLAAETTKLTQADQSVQARYLAATGDQAGSDLVNFDVSAAQQRQQLRDEWQSYLGDSYASNSDYSAQMLDLDKTLAAERLKIQLTYADQSLAKQKALVQSDQSVKVRYLAATGDQEGSDLLSFDLSAAQQEQQLRDEWQSYLGDSYASNSDYSAQMLDLDKTLAAERLKIQNTYSGQTLENQKQAQQSLSNTFGSLRDYAKSLSLSDASPLSVSDQYKAANDNLQTDYGKALGGDSTALASVQQDMQSFLSVSKKLNGGGIGYVVDYKQIQAMLQSLGSMNTDKLTADAMRLIVQDSTTTLATILQQILQAVAKNTTELRFQTAKAAA
ncbi:hypothetical protein ACI01nite_24970 [Acetobacter cibinongensis]|uniref:Phage related minor tail Protein n=2 Tax=Acetobacter cibinongensis TaxID=146475 RepID=A0A0D6N7D4_9PROT|nr:phage related minor tail Protein [Acetobacter cibinongensis]GEL59895.1 hypothetical protein ACI01nite_24970 [Acetobacter cibinongensis]